MERENRSRLLDGVRGLEQRLGWLGITIIMMIKETHGPIPLTFPPRGSSCSSERGNGTGIQQAKCPTGQKDRGLVSLSV